MLGYGEKETLLHCWWECKLIQPLWNTVWQFFKDLEIEIPFDPAIPLLGIYPAGSNGISASRSLRNWHTVFHKDWTNLHSHQQYKVLLFLHSLALLFPDFLIIVILTVMRWNLIVVLICISLTINDVELYFMFVGHISVFFWEVSISLATFWWGCLLLPCKFV